MWIFGVAGHRQYFSAVQRLSDCWYASSDSSICVFRQTGSSCLSIGSSFARPEVASSGQDRATPITPTVKEFSVSTASPLLLSINRACTRIETMFFGRPLQVTVRPMLRDRCPACPFCLSITLVYCRQMIGWMKMSLGKEVGLKRHCVRWRPSFPHGKEHSSPPTFRPTLLWHGDLSQQLLRFSCVCRRFSRFFAMETAVIVFRDSGGVLAEVLKL